MEGAARDAKPGICWVKPGERCWVWWAVDGTGLRDPAQLPASREAHEQWVSKGRGARSSRLCPAMLAEIRGASAQVRDFTRSYEVPVSQVLLWYEGLLVLDRISRASTEEVPWFKEVEELFKTERTKFKDRLSGYFYMRKRLFNVAVTGPSFVDCEGRICAHRRQPLRKINKTLPTEGEPQDPWYSVQSLVEYLPPWEAFLHPKCGLYQDFYLVQWGPPHDRVDYSATENGSDALPGATWEPDECLPDDLDAFRVAAKKQWADQQLKVEQKRGVGVAAAVADAGDTNGDTGPPPPKVARMADNPHGLKLISDLISDRIGHGIAKLLDSVDEKEIKKGWPKKSSEYPPPYLPADPPGCCEADCDCMEDWHLGRIPLGGKTWIESKERTLDVETALEGFTGMREHVTKRGLVSQQHFLESTKDNFRRQDYEEIALSASYGRMVLDFMRETCQVLPLGALRSRPGNAGRNVVSMLSSAFMVNEIHREAGGPFVPLQYCIVDAPPWVTVDAVTGETAVKDSLLPSFQAKQVFPLRLALTSIDLRRAPMDCLIDPHRPDTVDAAFGPVTAKVAGKAKGLMPPTLRSTVEMHLGRVFNFASSSCLDVAVHVWIQAMSDVALVTRAYAVGHIVQRREAAP